jgi:hypothetical protein
LDKKKMKESIIVLAAAMALLILPSAYALNCTIYSGDSYSLCSEINSLSADEDYKESLMDSNIYHFEESQSSVNLKLPDQSSQATFESIYENKIVTVVKIIAFIFVNYAFFSILTKSSFIRKWLTADS